MFEYYLLRAQFMVIQTKLQINAAETAMAQGKCSTDILSETRKDKINTKNK